MIMRSRRMARSPSPGLGVWMTEQGIAMAQFTPAVGPDKDGHGWYWLPQHVATGSEPAELERFAPQLLRQARQCSGFQACSLAMAIPPDQLQSYQFQFDSRLNLRQVQSQVREQLQTCLPWPLADAVWDFQVSRTAGVAPVAPVSGRPAWLDQALQAQPVHTVDVLAVRRAWAQACEEGCRQAGLQLVRLEPTWQASQRWQTYSQQQQSGVLQENTGVYGATLSEEMRAVAGGLALGAVMA